MRPFRTKFLLALAFVLAVAAASVFAYRASWHARRIRWANEPIRAWMTVPFIAHTHHVPAESLFQAIGVQPQQGDRRPLRRIAREKNRPVAEIIRDLESAIAKTRAQSGKQASKGP